MERLPRPKKGEVWTDYRRAVRIVKVDATHAHYENAESGRGKKMALRTFQLRFSNAQL